MGVILKKKNPQTLSFIFIPYQKLIAKLLGQRSN